MWELSADDSTRVDHYEVMLWMDEKPLKTIAKLPPGTNSYVDSLFYRTDALTLVYRIDALDLYGNRAVGTNMIVIHRDPPDTPPIILRDKDDLPVYILVPDGRTPFIQDFEDFLAFARAFETKRGDPNFNVLADITYDGEVTFVDFVEFAKAYGRRAVPHAFSGDI